MHTQVYMHMHMLMRGARREKRTCMCLHTQVHMQVHMRRHMSMCMSMSM